MKSALVFGGTRFFGVNLVEALVAKGVQVTVATRQHSDFTFGEEVEMIKVDRTNEASVKAAIDGRKWDVVYDQICFNAKEARIAVECFKNNIERYIFTSTMSVYPFEENLKEDMFDPYLMNISDLPQEDITYQVGKQQAEAVYFQEANFPVVAVRIPIVLGEHDYTNRLTLHIERVRNQEAIGFPNLEAEMGFIHQSEVGKFLAWVGEQNFTGPINACANQTWTMKRLISEIEQEVGKKAILPEKFDSNIQSPYGVETSWNLSNEKAKELGFCFSNLEDWLPALIKKMHKNKV